MSNRVPKGLLVKINGSGDLAMESEARKFIDEHCVTIKQTKAGLVQVYLLSNPKKRISVPKSNVGVVGITSEYEPEKL